jgi:hypothetical protein
MDLLHESVMSHLLRTALHAEWLMSRGEWQQRQVLHWHTTARILSDSVDFQLLAHHVIIGMNAAFILSKLPPHLMADIEPSSASLWQPNTGVVSEDDTFEVGRPWVVPSYLLEDTDASRGAVARLKGLDARGEAALRTIVTIYDSIFSAWHPAGTDYKFDSSVAPHPASIRTPTSHFASSSDPVENRRQREEQARDVRDCYAVLQTHTHRRDYCFKSGSCRFGAPWPISETTTVEVEVSFSTGKAGKPKDLRLRVKIAPTRNDSMLVETIPALMIVVRSNSNAQMILDVDALFRYVLHLPVESGVTLIIF